MKHQKLDMDGGITRPQISFQDFKYTKKENVLNNKDSFIFNTFSVPKPTFDLLIYFLLTRWFSSLLLT